MRGNLAALGIGVSSTPNRAEEATFNALECPLLDVSYDGLTGAIIHITGGEDMKISEAARPAEIVSELMDKEALVIWGARIDSSFDSRLQVSLILTGVRDKQTDLSLTQHKTSETFYEEELEKIMEELGVKAV
ncbi:MAG: hypothetical protein ABDH32_07895 [Candidatus Caldarchaeales archaeon]